MALSKANVEKAESLYVEKFKGRGIPSRQAGILKEVMAKALSKGEKAIPAARAWLKEKGIDLKEAEQPAAKSEPEKLKEAKEEKKEAPKAEAKPKKEKDEFEPVEKPSKIDRDLLAETLVELGVAAPPKATGEELRALLHEALAKAVGGKVEDPLILKAFAGQESRLFGALHGCLGLYVDFRSADCVVCPDQAQCVREYLVNFRTAFRRTLTKNGLQEEVDRVATLIEKAIASLEPVRMRKGTVELAEKAKLEQKPLVPSTEKRRKTPVGKITSIAGNGEGSRLELPGKPELGTIVMGKDEDGVLHPMPDRVTKEQLVGLGYTAEQIAIFEKAKGSGDPNGVNKVEKSKEKVYDPNDWLVAFDVERNPEKPATAAYYFAKTIIEEGSMQFRDFASIYNKYGADMGMTFTEAVEHVVEAGIGCPAKELPKDIVDGMSKADKRAVGLLPPKKTEK